MAGLLLGLEPMTSLQRIFRLRRGDRPSHPISLALAAELDIVRPRITMPCAPLSFPPEWESVVRRDFLLGIPLIGPQVKVHKSVCAQLAQRGPECWREWGSSRARVSLAQFASAALGKAAGWPHPFFVPDDPFTLVGFNYRATSIDGLEVLGALREIERHVGVSLSSAEWEQLASGTFGAAIDHLLEAGRRSGA